MTPKMTFFFFFFFFFFFSKFHFFGESGLGGSYYVPKSDIFFLYRKWFGSL